MPRTLEELAKMIARRDSISYEEGLAIVRDCAAALESAFADGNIDEAEDIVRDYMGLEPDYLDLFIL